MEKPPNRMSVEEMPKWLRKLTEAHAREAELIRQARNIEKDLAELRSFIKTTKELLDDVVNL